MKAKYINILASAAVLVGASSCVDLETAPLDQKSDSTMWLTQQDAEQAVSMLYNYIPDAMWANDEDIYTDNSVHGIKWAVGQRAHSVWQSTDFSWKNEYAYIRRANKVLENIENIQDIDAESKNRIMGQAYFFRGMIYFNLIKQFGDVPYYDRSLEMNEQDDITRTDWKTVYDKVMADFDEAIKLLPVSYTFGRITKGAAYAYKARAALYFANPACPHSVSDGYQVAATAAKACMDLGVYDLYDGNYAGTAKDYDGNYSSMFWDLNLDNSDEGIVVVRGIAGFNGSYFIGFEAFPTVGWGGTNPTQSFVDCFEDVEGAPIEKSTIYNPLKPYENRDPRLATNVLFSGQTMYGIEVHTEPLPSSGVRGLYQMTSQSCGDATLTGYHARKWLNPDVYPGSDGWDHSYAAADMRYAEVLLTYAEAKNELTGLDPEAFAAVNKVRARVGMPALQNNDASLPTYCASQDDLRQRIRNEWRVEFGFEGDHRQWDVRRWNIAKEVLNAPRLGFAYTLREDAANAKPGDNGLVCDLYVGDNVIVTNQTIIYDDHNYVFPVPQYEIDLNSNIKQNPGYN